MVDHPDIAHPGYSLLRCCLVLHHPFYRYGSLIFPENFSRGSSFSTASPSAVNRSSAA